MALFVTVLAAMMFAHPASSSSIAATAAPLIEIALTHSIDRQVVEIGDVIGYRYSVTNLSSTPVDSVELSNRLPIGFQYVAGSVRTESEGGFAATDSATQIGTRSDKENLYLAIGQLPANSTVTFRCQVRVTANAGPGEHVSSVVATAISSFGDPTSSETATAAVTVRRGLLSQRQIIVGRVFDDRNGNGLFDSGDSTISGARIVLSTGQSVITDSKGFYSVPSLGAGAVVVSLDPISLPEGYVLGDNSTRDGDSWTRLLRTPLGGGTLLRQNFPLTRKKQSVQLMEITGDSESNSNAASGIQSGTQQEQSSEAITITPQSKAIPADGRASTLVRVRAPAGTREVRLRTSNGQLLPSRSETDRMAVGSIREQILTLKEGEAEVLLVSANVPGIAKLEAETGPAESALRAEAEVVFEVEQRPPLLVGLGELSIGRAAPAFEGSDQGGSVHERGSVFLQHSLFRRDALTFAYNSEQAVNTSSGVRRMFELDPRDRVYPVLGDSSTRFEAAQTNSKVYARLDHERSYVMFGDLRGNESDVRSGITNYGRNLTGLRVHLENNRRDFITVQGARPDTSFGREVISGYTFGLARLSHADVLPGSETVILEVRDRRNPEIVLSREALVRSVDYTVDWATGGIFFLRSLSSFDSALNLRQIVLTYEYRTTGIGSSIYALNTEKQFNASSLVLGASVVNQRQPGLDDYLLTGLRADKKLPRSGRLHVEIPVTQGALPSSDSSFSNGSLFRDVHGKAIRAQVDQPINVMNGVLRASVSKTDTGFLNPFGATTVPGSQVTRGSVEIKPRKSALMRVGVTDERNRTDIVNNERQTISAQWTQSLRESLRVTLGYDHRSLDDAVRDQRNEANAMSTTMEWRATSRLQTTLRRDQNLTTPDPTYPDQSVLTAKYKFDDATQFFLTQRMASAPIVPIADLRGTGFSSVGSRHETSIGVETKWKRYTSISSRYQLENGINGADSFAVIGLVNRIPVRPDLSVDLGMERGTRVSGQGQNFNSGTMGLAWLPTERIRTSTRYELRDRQGFGHIFTAGGAGKISESMTTLTQLQYSRADYAGLGTQAIQGTEALALRPMRSDRSGLLFSYTVRSSVISGPQRQTERVGVLSTDGYLQPAQRLELYGKVALSDRALADGEQPASGTLTYLWQGRAQYRITRLVDAAAEGRVLDQPATNTSRWTIGNEAGFWLIPDLRLALGYSFKTDEEIQANFLNNPVRRGAYFVLSTKLSNLFDLFGTPRTGLARN